MAQGKRNRLSSEQRIEMWRRWKAGESFHEIGRAFGKAHGSIRFLLKQRGGIVPPARRRSPRTLTLAEREDISRGIAAGSSIREIASGLQRPVSTVSREVTRHGGRPLYRASEADRQAWESALRPKACLLANHEELRSIVVSKLILDWSPEQISKWLKVHYPSDESMRVSHETIYRSLFIQARGVLKKELIQHLRSKRSIRRSRHSRAGGKSQGQIVDAISIRERPAEVEDRAVPGHWEGDLLAGSKNTPPPTFESIMELAEAAIDRFHEPGGLIGIGLGPSAPQRCSRRLLEATIELARRRGVAWQTHVLETKTQALSSRDLHGESFVELMGEQGLLGPDTTLVHTVWLSDRDIEIMASHDCAAVHCLLSNLRLGDGVARLPALRRAGVRVALGTDGRGCDETLDMFELAKMTALVHKVRGGEYRNWVRAAQVLRMATVEGSAVAGHGRRLGRIEPGAKGDLILMRRNSLAFVPVNDPVRQLVYGAPSRDVDTVIVNGRVTVRQGGLVGVDTEWLTDRVRAHAHEALMGTATPESLELERVVSDMYARMDARPLDLGAYLNA